MINFSQRDEVVPSALILLSIVILALTLIFMLAVPAPTTQSITSGEKSAKRHMYSDIADAKKRGAQTSAVIAPMLWTGTTDTVSAGAILAQPDIANRSAFTQAWRLSPATGKCTGWNYRTAIQRAD